jgi:predicted PurR-regulated permease PerM
MTFPPPTEKQARVIWLAATGLAVAVLVGLLVALVWGLGRVLQILSPVLWPLAIAGVIVYLLDPVVDRFEKTGLPRVVSIICVFGIALLLVAAVFGSVVPQIVSETRQFVSHVPEYSAKLEQRIETWIENPPPLIQKILKRAAPPAETSIAATNSETISTTTTNVAGNVAKENTSQLNGALDQKTLQSAKDWLANALPKIGRWLFGQVGRMASWFGFLVGLALVPVYAFYLLLERRGIESSWTDYLPVADSKFKDELVFVLRSINGYLIAFFRDQVLVAMCDAVLYTTGFLIIGLQYASLIGAAALVLTMIPFLGAITICVTALIIAVVQYGDWLHPLLVLAVFAVVQSLEGLVISPRIMGGRVGLPPLAIIIAVMAGTTLLGGLLGGVLAIPLTAVLRVLLARYVWKKRVA